MCSELSVPLHVRGERRGVISAVRAERDFFREEDATFLQAVARWTGLIVHRAELMDDLLASAEDRTRREMIERLLGQLTPRQREVASLIASGCRNRQIAEQLVLTTGTVANHVAQLLDRLGLDTRTQVAALVAELGLHREHLALEHERGHADSATEDGQGDDHL